MNDERKVALGKRIKESIRRSGKNQQQVAKELGISNNALSNYSNGKRVPDAVLLAEIARACEVDPLWLLTGKSIEMPRASVVHPMRSPLASVTNEQLQQIRLDLLETEHVELQAKVKELERRVAALEEAQKLRRG